MEIEGRMFSQSFSDEGMSVLEPLQELVVATDIRNGYLF